MGHRRATRLSAVQGCAWTAPQQGATAGGDAWVAVLDVPEQGGTVRGMDPAALARCVGDAAAAGADAVLALVPPQWLPANSTALVAPAGAGFNWTAALGTGALPAVAVSDAVSLPVDNANGLVLVVDFAEPTPAPTPALPPVPPTHAPAIPGDGSSRDSNGAHHRVIIFVGFCVACFFVSSLYCRTRSAQAQHNAAIRRSLWLVTLLEHEASSQARLQVRSETAGRILATLPVRTFGEEQEGEEAGEGADGGGQMAGGVPAGGDKDTCCICIDEYAKGDRVAKLPCGHEFHSDCIAPWLEQQCVCPLCKRDLLEGTGEDRAAFETPPGTPPEGWRAFLELLLETQFGDDPDARRELVLERPAAPEPPEDYGEDGDTMVVNYLGAHPPAEDGGAAALATLETPVHLEDGGVGDAGAASWGGSASNAGGARQPDGLPPE